MKIHRPAGFSPHAARIILCLASMVVAGCAPKAQTQVPADVSPTASPSHTATQAPELTPSPTATEAPELTPSPTGTPDLSKMTVVSNDFVSPDGDWVMTVINALPLDANGVPYADYAYDQVKVYNTESQQEWIPIERWTHGGLGIGGYVPLLWTPNGKYLYITYKPLPGGCAVFVNGSDLSKLDLETGSLVQIVPDAGLWLSLSPDETMLAYIGYGDRGLVIRDLATGAERQVKLDPGAGYQAGHILWSPAGEALVLTLAIRPCSTNWAESTSVVRIDVPTLEQKPLIPEDERLFTTLEWPTPNEVVLRDGSGNLWSMDPDSGEITAK
jgi:hypothetical protein